MSLLRRAPHNAPFAISRRPQCLLKPLLLPSSTSSSPAYSTLLSSSASSISPRPRRSITHPPQLHPQRLERQSRHFSIHSAASSLVDTAESLILSLHDSTGLPWLYTVPLAALILRACLTLPFSVYAHTRANRILELQPLVEAWSKVIMKRTAGMRDALPRGVKFNRKRLGMPVAYDNVITTTTPKDVDGGEGGEGSGVEKKEKITPQEWMKASYKEMRRKRKEIYRQQGTQAWKSYLGLIQIPMWVTASLAIRRLCGRDVEGLWFGVGARSTTTETTIDVSTPAEAATSITEDPASTILQDSTATIPAPIPEAVEAARASMALESIPGWLPSLLEPDPLYILPLIFSLSIFLNVELQSSNRPARSRFTRGFRNGIRFVSVAIFPLTMNQPVVLHLYWCASAIYSVFQNILLEKTMPSPKSTVKEEEKVSDMAYMTKIPMKLRDEEKGENFRVVDGRKVFVRGLRGIDVGKDDWMWDMFPDGGKAMKKGLGIDEKEDEKEVEKTEEKNTPMK